MKVNKQRVDKVIAVVVSLATAALPILVTDNVISSVIAADIGSAIAAAMVAYHGGATVANKSKN